MSCNPSWCNCTRNRMMSASRSRHLLGITNKMLNFFEFRIIYYISFPLCIPAFLSLCIPANFLLWSCWYFFYMLLDPTTILQLATDGGAIPKRASYSFLLSTSDGRVLWTAGGHFLGFQAKIFCDIANALTSATDLVRLLFLITTMLINFLMPSTSVLLILSHLNYQHYLPNHSSRRYVFLF